MENKNFVEKTVRKFELNNGSQITNQKDILREMGKFYNSLFKNRDQYTQNYQLNNFLNNSKEKRICDSQLGNKITADELSNALKNMKHNKSPGIDGISAVFLKVFWGQLKFFVRNAINCIHEQGQLSVSLRKSILTCLPKGNKDRKFIKNWRPISLLCVVYKLASSVIAARLKPHLEHIISSSQSGFLKGRHMGECTRIIYDIMYHTEKKHIPGLLMLIDFEKAFDSLSWKFLYKTLNYFGFNEKFISWIQLFNTHVNADVLQSGFLSNPIAIQRGCRQGDPIAPYLFLIVAEILTLFIENEPKIKVIQIGKTMLKLTQYADDTTIILDGTTSSLQATLNLLEIFGSLSGLNINCDKTKFRWIGNKKTPKKN